MADEDLAVEEDGSDVFEIDDFTAASEWERFIYRIEDILGSHGWGLDNTQNKPRIEADDNIEPDKDSKEPGIWKSDSKHLKFYNIGFLMLHHRLQENKVLKKPNGQNEELPKALIDSIDFEFDFCPRSYPLSRWFGLKEFIALSSLDDTADTESKIKVLLSSINIALSDCKCQIPMFVQVGKRERRLFFGTSIGGGFRTTYEMINLRYTPHQCNHVQGMVNVFKEKLACALADTISVSIRFAYSIRDWQLEKRLPCYEFSADDGDVMFERMPFAPLEDPIKELQVAASWPYISSEILVDDEISSQLDACHAPVWKLKAKSNEFSQAALSRSLKSLLALSQQKSRTTKQIIRSLSATETHDEGLSGNVGQALDRLAGPSAFASPKKILSTQLTDFQQRRVLKTNLLQSPLSPDVLDLLLVCLFPDAGLSKEDTLELQLKLNQQQTELESDSSRHKDQFRHIKSAPVDSLTYKLGLCIAGVNDGHGGLQAVAHLWHEFVLEMRYRFENNISIPCLAQVKPNFNYCLLHQKLQMLNCCIERSQNREGRMKSTSDSDADFNAMQESENSFTSCKSVSYKDFDDTPSRSHSNVSDNQRPTGAFSDILSNLEGNSKPDSPKDASWSSLLSNLESTKTTNENPSNSHMTDDESDDGSDDEFFEAQEEIDTDDVILTSESVAISNENDDGERVADGVAQETEMKLLCTGKTLCIPETQEAPPLTEDTLMEQQEILTQLGTSEEGSRVRVQMQCASLLSDMEAFKAANPGCILEDFVRWYSPNDWSPGPETDEEREELEKILKAKEKNNPDSSKEGWEFELDDATNVMTNKSENWYEEGRLSLRMRVPGNTWQEVWGQAKAVPARRQKRLFDDTKEAEKILHYFDNLSPSEIVLHVFPIILQASIKRVIEEGDNETGVNKLVEEVTKETSRLHSPLPDSLQRIEKIIKKLYEAEMLILKTKSLRYKLYERRNWDTKDDELEMFIQDLLVTPEVPVKGGSNSRIGKSLMQLLRHQKGADLIGTTQRTQRQDPQPTTEVQSLETSQIKGLPKPIGREYILRTTSSRPSKFSRPSPQRLFVVIMPDDFRMAGSFTQDTTFL